VIDFEKMFESNGLSPLPDAELKELLVGLAQYLTEDAIAAYTGTRLRSRTSGLNWP
jgi:hypothetical protein